MGRQLTHSEVIVKFRKAHGGKYDYSLVDYIRASVKVKIICPKHGVFEQYPMNHFKGVGCSKCGREVCADKLKAKQEDVIRRFEEIHGDKYDFSKVRYKSNKDKVVVACKNHGEFSIDPTSLLVGCGCNKCGNEEGAKKLRTSKEAAIKLFQERHGDKYDYSRMKWTGMDKKVDIVCKKHGVFRQRASEHRAGVGCPTCGFENSNKNRTKTNAEFIQEASEVHNGLYDYTKTEYTKDKNKVVVTCHIHGDFEQVASGHLQGRGCGECAKEKNGWGASSFHGLCNGGNGTLYVILCSNKDESFYKIGITSRGLRKRFSKCNLPYDYKTIYRYEGHPVDVFYKEVDLLRYHKENRYSPKIRFKGETECFRSIDMNYITHYDIEV